MQYLPKILCGSEQWAKCANDEDADAKIALLQIPKAALAHLELNSADITYLGLQRSQNLQTNYEVQTTNLGEQNHSRIQEIRCLPIVHCHKEFLEDTARMFTLRLSQALSYQTQGKLIVPDAIKKTIDGAEHLKSRGWTVSIAGTVTSTGSAGSATSVKYSVTKLNDSGSLKMFEVTLSNNDKQEWYHNIKCKCNRTKAYGQRPCYHASLCLVNPPNNDCNKCFCKRSSIVLLWTTLLVVHKKFHVSSMIEQYSKPVKMPSFNQLKKYRLFPPMIFKLPGKNNYFNNY